MRRVLRAGRACQRRHCGSRLMFGSNLLPVTCREGGNDEVDTDSASVSCHNRANESNSFSTALVRQGS